MMQEENFYLCFESEGDKSFEQEDVIRLSKWFKINRSKLEDQCKGFLRVEENEIMRENLRNPALSRAIPCFYEVFSSKEKAFSCVLSQK